MFNMKLFEYPISDIIIIATCERKNRKNRAVGAGGVPRVPWYPPILSDQLTLSQPGEQVMPVTTCSPGFSDLPTTLKSNVAITGLNTELCKC